MGKGKKAVSEAGPRRPFVFVHVGDLHLVVSSDDDTREQRRRKKQLEHDLNGILTEIAAIEGDAFDFVYLPGDIADDGYADQYAILEAALKAHPPSQLRLIPGDHDRQHGCMKAFAAFHAGSGQPEPIENEIEMDDCFETITQFYFSEEINGVKCVFLDMVSAGHGRKGIGLDFRLGDKQAKWFADEVRSTLDADGRPRIPCAVFMHTYPADLHVRAEAADVAGVIWNGHVRLVEMGHTHYNEITPDGRTHYAAARSVGQNEDGSVGYAVCALDEDVVSWRFKPLDKDWPFVLITSPADRRVATRKRDDADAIELRALVITDRTAVQCEYRVDDGFWRDMHAPTDHDRCFTARVAWPADAKTISVRAYHPAAAGKGVTEFDIDVIEPVRDTFVPRPRPAAIGSDTLHLHAWPQKGLRGDQLGPNRVGRNW